MTYVTRILVLLLAGLFVMGASASADDRLSVSGKADTRITFTENFSLYDRNYTGLSLGSPANPGQAGDEDALSHAMTRFNLMFTIEAFENSKAVLHTIVDKEWGGGGVLFGNGAATAAYGGSAAIEGYWFEGLIPGTAAKFEIGVPYINGDAGDLRIFNTAAPGITLNTPFSDTISNFTWYAWLGQDFDGFGTPTISGTGDRKGVGNDWAAGTRFHISFMEGLSVDLIYALYMNECAAHVAACGDEIGNWVSGKLHYQYGDFSITPSLTLYLADHDTMSDTESFLLDIRAAYVTGPLSLEGRVVYTPGDSDSQDRSYDVVGGKYGVWGIPQSVKWFGLFGNTAFNDLGPLTTIQGNSSIAGYVRLETFGLMHAAAKAAYTVTPQTTISAAFGLFNSAEETSGTPMDFIDGDGVDHSGGATYAGGSHVAAEIDAWLDYQLYSNATISIWAAYAMTGDALDLMMNNMIHESQDVLGAGARVNYSF